MSSFDESEAFEAASGRIAVRAGHGRAAAALSRRSEPRAAEAVQRLDGPVLMLAGAGTGKTRALTARIAHLLATGTARPNEILAVTFTNKAAREMKNRVGGALGQPVEGMPWLGTFHAICVKLLRRHAELVGLKSNFTILDTDDQVRLLKQLIQAEGIDENAGPRGSCRPSSTAGRTAPDAGQDAPRPKRGPSTAGRRRSMRNTRSG
jgi:DNA helicase-2/ATP-dependent DNA helicase PcrA